MPRSKKKPKTGNTFKGIILTIVFSFVGAGIFYIASDIFAGISYKEKFDPNMVQQLSVANDSVLIDNFLGANAVYHGFSFFPPDEGVEVMNDNDRAVQFERLKKMDLKLARTYYRPAWSYPKGFDAAAEWNSPKMEALYKWLSVMKQQKVDVAIQAGWYFPNDTFIGHAMPDSTRDTKRYAEWVNESLQKLIVEKGFDNIKYLLLFTEPLNYPQKHVPRIFTQPEYYAKVCEAIHHKLITTGLRSRIKLVGPNSGSTDTAAFVGWSVERLNKVLDVYSWHTYNGKMGSTNPPLEYDGWKEIADAGVSKISGTGKPYWIDEYAANKPNPTVRTKADYGNYLAQSVAAFTNSGAQTSLLWLLFDQKYEGGATNKDSFFKGVQRVGLTPYPHDEGRNAQKVFPAWYAFSIMSKYLASHQKTVAYKTQGKDGVYIVATESAERISVMVVNAHHQKVKFNIKFKKAINCNFERYLYNPAQLNRPLNGEMITADKRTKKITTAMADSLPARGVSIYTSLKIKAR